MARDRGDSLRRRVATREPKRRFTLICEGKNTEPEYFRALQATLPGALIELIVEPAVGAPMTIAKRAATLRRKARTGDSFAQNDEIWAVFDRDEHPNFDEAVRLCANKGISVARSNPCFEVWLILHHADFHAPDGRHAVQARLTEFHPEYAPNRGKRLDFSAILDKRPAAEMRAERQLAAREAEGSPFGPPSTTVFELTQAIARASERSSPGKK